MGRKIKKSTSFRVDLAILDALAAKADRISEQTGRSYSVATIVEAVLAVAAEQPDEDTIAAIAKHKFGIEVAIPVGGRFGGLVDRLRRLTTGHAGDMPRILASEWVQYMSVIPLKGLKKYDLGWALHNVIQRMRSDPDKVQSTLDTSTPKHGGNELIQLLYRLLELVRGQKDEQELLNDIDSFYMLVSVFSDFAMRPKISELLQSYKDQENYERVESVRELLEIGESIAARSQTIK